jgi:hyperosmotically inducible protein
VCRVAQSGSEARSTSPGAPARGKSPAAYGKTRLVAVVTAWYRTCYRYIVRDSVPICTRQTQEGELMTKSLRVSSLWFGALSLLVTVGCSSTQTVGEEIDDATITTKIESKLTGDPDVSAFNVDVDTNDGVVRLSGEVETAEAKAEAEELARETEGVRRVINDITVGEGRGAGERLSDTEITTKIKAKITGDGDLSPFNINVDTKDGVVTLRGTVKSMESKQEAEQIARDTSGVKEVQNMLQVEAGE